MTPRASPLDEQLTDVIAEVEAIDWREVPEVSPAEASAWVDRLAMARSQLRVAGEVDVGP